jgi:asparagine synthase (glutamine-hydrolysing)
MSGIVGLANFDGSPVEFGLLSGLTHFLAYRGPDNQQIWIKENVGFGHALLKTTEDSQHDSQPLTLDGKRWIVADARIDAREELVAAFNSAGEGPLVQSNGTDAELILHAYRLWGVHCVEHLVGDFAFGIWDDSRQQLFCARDHMGVKPFYYAQIGSSVIFSNSLDCIREQPLVAGRLNDNAIADFLLFEVNQNPASTFFGDIQRLPPAHSATWSRVGLRLLRYWSLPVDEPLFYKRAADYTDHFHDLLRKSIADRLRSRRVWVFMSGGIDSPTLAAAARELLHQRSETFEVQALTQIHSSLPDERTYAEMAANYLRIPIQYRDDTENSNWEDVPFSLPEPCPDGYHVASERQFWSQLGNYSRVFFYGEGPDNALLFEWRPYVANLLRRRYYKRLMGGLLSTAISERRPPFWGRISKAVNAARYDDCSPRYPDWLNPDFASRLQLPIRWNAFRTTPAPLHPLRPKGYASLQSPLWQFLFERLDTSVTKALFEVRYPFLDIRLLRFFLALPALPWCRSKHLLRRAMRGRLPKPVLRRRKASIDARRMGNLLKKFCQAPFRPTPAIYRFINPAQLNSLEGDDIESNLRIRSLNHWLQNLHRSSHNLQETIVCDRTF